MTYYEKIVDLLSRGYSIEKIAKETGIDSNTLRGWLKVKDHIAKAEVEEKSAAIRKKKERERLNSELLPCPFCGGKAEIRNETVRDTPSDRYEVVFVTCLDCGASTERKVSDGYYGLRCRDDEIAALWNRRVDEERENKHE